MRRNSFRWVLLKQALMQKKAKALLIVLAVAMGASVVSALLNLQRDLRYRMNRELRDYGPNVLVVPDAHATNTLEASVLPALLSVKDGPKILAASPELYMT